MAQSKRIQLSKTSEFVRLSRFGRVHSRIKVNDDSGAIKLTSVDGERSIVMPIASKRMWRSHRPYRALVIRMARQELAKAS